MYRNNILIPFILALLSLRCQAQDYKHTLSKDIRADFQTEIKYLSSDELKGRDTGTPELKRVASHIATYYYKNRVGKVPGSGSYQYKVPLQNVQVHGTGTIEIGGQQFINKEDFYALTGGTFKETASYVFLNANDISKTDKSIVKDKYIVFEVDKKVGTSFSQFKQWVYEKHYEAIGKGAKGSLVIFSNASPSWSYISGKLVKGFIQLAPKISRPLFLINDAKKTRLSQFKEAKSKDVNIDFKETGIYLFNSQNVVGYIEGKDSKLKKEVVMLSAHYDHLGVGKPVDGDSIYNGARDNAVGAAAVMMAAKYFEKSPPKRSMLFVHFTAEEKGLLGSTYFSDNSPIPLEKIVFNLNVDGAGYNDKSIATVVGLNRTNMSAQITSGTALSGLEAQVDAMPSFNLFDRSDNVSFARKGIPAITYSMGFTAFDSEIGKYYHQVNDEASSLDWGYLGYWLTGYIKSATNIANSDIKPFWITGDKYEAAGKKLYKIK